MPTIQKSISIDQDVYLELIEFFKINGITNQSRGISHLIKLGLGHNEEIEKWKKIAKTYKAELHKLSKLEKKS